MANSTRSHSERAKGGTVYRKLNAETHRQILDLLAEGPRTRNDVRAQLSDVTPGLNATDKLRALVGLVTEDPETREWSIERPTVRALIARIGSWAVAPESQTALARLAQPLHREILLALLEQGSATGRGLWSAAKRGGLEATSQDVSDVLNDLERAGLVTREGGSRRARQFVLRADGAFRLLFELVDASSPGAAELDL